jgi:hypothetical protein
MRTVAAPDALLRRWAAAWGALTGAFALHVIDEATHDFLAWYDPIAASIQARLGVPFPPVFTFRVRLGGLCAAVVLLGALTPLVRRGRRWLVAAALVYAGIHLVNGTIHLVGSALAGRVLPGTLSAPLLVAAAALLAFNTRAVRAVG